MKKLTIFLAFLLFAGFSVQAQMQITGTVTGAEDGLSIPGVSIVVKNNPTIGTTTNVDGEYSLTVPSGTEALIFSFIGMKSQEVIIGGRSVINVMIKAEILEMEEVIVTALGISREKKSLGYSVQEIGGAEVALAKDASFISSLSGKVSGVQIKKPGQMGGSVNVLIRGSNSFTGNNQALFVVDGVPISNRNTNTSANARNSGGYDYGNAASDIDPESIESISVLKGATAAALYGSDAANGVILITTKKGTAKKGIGVTVNQSVAFSTYDKSTFPEYQDEYGAGYGPYYSGGDHPGLFEYDLDGDGTDDLVVPFGEDASFGEAYDPNLMVYQWNSIYPQLDTYGQKTPWVAAKNDAGTFFQTGLAYTTNIALDGGNEDGTFRFAYTNDDRSGIVENSKIKKDVIDFAGSYNLTDKFKVDGKMVYTRISGQGRYGTGYDGGNVMQSIKQWYQTNVDMQDQRDAYMSTHENISWNASSASNIAPHYFDNPYWVIYENYETDERNRTFGKFQGMYDITENLSLTARFGLDTYSDLREERVAITSLDQPRYEKYESNFQEYNYDLMAAYDKRFSENFSLKGLFGFNAKDKYIRSTRSETTGGLVVPRVYALSNSQSALSPPVEFDAHQLKYGYYGQLSVGLMDMWYVEGSLRIDQSSTLPEDNNTYMYPSVSSSFLFSELLDMSWLSFGKLRVGYAQVGNDAPSYSILNAYTASTPFGNSPMYYIDDVSNNPELKSETTSELEFGLEMNVFQDRVGFDVSYYDKKTIDQILPVQISTASGYNLKYVNAGEMKNTGIELGMFAVPVKTNDFQWNININWAQNKNEVVSLFEDSENLLIYSNWSTAINARKGEPYGTITGTDFVYLNGQKVVGADGKYLRTESTEEVIGNIQPDWNAGISSNLSYKGLSFGFLIDMQKGGDIVSYDMAFGQATGLYATTAGLNELGNPIRDRVADGGGVLLEGVTADGLPNTTRAEAYNYLTPFGYYGGSNETGVYAPDAQLVYDASYVKLREVTLEYKLPDSLVEKMQIFTDVSLAIYGRNLWIISKNFPYGDPEYMTGSGNSQGIQNATYPTAKELGFNIRVKL